MKIRNRALALGLATVAMLVAVMACQPTPQVANQLNPTPAYSVTVSGMWEDFQPHNKLAADAHKNRWVSISLDWEPATSTADGKLVFRGPSTPNTLEMRFNFVEDADELRDDDGDGNTIVVCNIGGTDKLTANVLILNYCRIPGRAVNQDDEEDD